MAWGDFQITLAYSNLSFLQLSPALDLQGSNNNAADNIYRRFYLWMHVMCHLAILWYDLLAIDVNVCYFVLRALYKFVSAYSVLTSCKN